MIPGFLLRWRTILLLACLAVILLLALGIPRSGLDTSVSALMTRSDPYLDEFNRMQALFPAPLEVSFAIVPDNGRVFDQVTLAALADLNREFRRIPSALAMTSILRWQSPYGEDTLFDRLYQLESYTEEELEQRRIRAREELLVNGILVSPDADLTLATVLLEKEALTPEERRQVAETSLQLREELQMRHPGVQVHVSSSALYEESTRAAMIRDLTRLLPIVLLLCTLIICFSFRSVFAGLSILITALFVVVMTAGIFGWLALSFNTISVMAPLVVVTIAVANSVHILSVYRQNLVTSDRESAMLQSLQFNLRPVTLATLTTAIGFAGLNMASSPAVSSFGTVVAVGVCCAWLLALLALPGVILLLPIRPAPPAEGSILIPRLLLGCEQLVLRHGKVILRVVAFLGILAFFLSFRNEVDFDRMSFIDEDSPLHDYYEAVSAKMDQGPVLSYGIDTKREDGVLEPRLLQALDQFAAWLRDQPEVVAVASLVEVVKAVNQVLDENRPESYRIPATAAEVEQHLLDYQQVQRRGFTLDTLVTPDLTLLRLFITTRPLSNQGIIDFNDRLEQEFAATVSDSSLLHGSSVLLFARMDKAVTIELLQGFAFSLVLITLLLMVGIRSLSFGLLTALPNLLPATLVFGLWGVLVGQIDPFVMMLFSISIGLVVDDSVHMLSAWHRFRQRGYPPQEAVRAALQTAGPALLITTTIMAVGTCVLIAASTLYFQQAATLLVPIVVLAVLLDLTFFPALLLHVDQARNNARRNKEPQ